MSLYPLRRLLLPLALFGIAGLLRLQIPLLAPEYRALLEWSPYLTLGIALALCTFFNRSRPFVAALGLALLYFVIRSELQMTLATPRAFLLFALASLVWPLGLLCVLFMPERGLLNRHGLKLLAIFPLLLIPCWIVLERALGSGAALAIDWMPLRPWPHYLLSVGASAVFAAAFIANIFVLLRRDSEDAAALFIALLAAYIVLAFFDQRWISTVMIGTAGLAIAASQVRSSYDMAYRDQLTGILGRRALDERLKGLGSRYTIAMLDVDHFKKFNDTYGHDVGDDVLKMVAAQIDKVDGGGYAYRYGGEEFSVVFPGKELEDCEPHLEQVRRAVGRYHLALRDVKHREVPKKVAEQRRGRRRVPREQTVSVTISIGVAERSDRAATPEEVIKAADAALYRAKEKGRNCLSH